MANGYRVLAIASLFLAVLATPLARADTITITSGGATVAWDDPPFFSLQGDGFQLSSGFFLVPASPQDACFTGCAPGTIVDLSTIMGGPGENSLGQAQSAMVNGVTYASPDDFETWLRLRGQFTFEAGSVMVPPLTEPGGDTPALFLTAPFIFQGQVAGFPQNQTGGDSLFQVSLSGRGTARLRLINAGDLWRFPEVSFTFQPQAPVPEPASLLLIAGGAAGLLIRSRYPPRDRRL
jgi:hypothetical protein